MLNGIHNSFNLLQQGKSGLRLGGIQGDSPCHAPLTDCTVRYYHERHGKARQCHHSPERLS